MWPTYITTLGSACKVPGTEYVSPFLLEIHCLITLIEFDLILLYTKLWTLKPGCTVPAKCDRINDIKDERTKKVRCERTWHAVGKDHWRTFPFGKRRGRRFLRKMNIHSLIFGQIWLTNAINFPKHGCPLFFTIFVSFLQPNYLLSLNMGQFAVPYL